MAGRGKGGPQSGKLGGLTYVKQMPNFLAKFGGAAQEEGIEAALKRHAERGGEAADRSDNEDEQPQVVELRSTVSSSDKHKEPTGKRADSFTQRDSVSSKFAEAAYLRVQQSEEKAKRANKGSTREVQAPSDDGDAGAVAGKHVFKASTAASSSSAKKRKAPPPQRTAAAKVRNPSMLSFSEDGEDC